MNQDLLFLYNIFPYFRLLNIDFTNPHDPARLMFKRLQETGLNATWHNPFFAPALNAQGQGSMYGARCLGGQSPLVELQEYVAQLTGQLKQSASWLYGAITGNNASLWDHFSNDPATHNPAERFDRRQFAPGHPDPESVIRDWVRAAHQYDLRPMADLVMNHVSTQHPWVIAEDTLLSTAAAAGAQFDDLIDGRHSGVLQRVVFPDGSSFVPLFKRKANGYPIFHTEDDGKVWNDIASFNWENPAVQPVLLEKFQRLTEYFIDLGFRGFRCDAAFLVPGGIWQQVIAHADQYAREHAAEYARKFAEEYGIKYYYNDLAFLAETVGGPRHQVAQLENTGFDYTLTSMRWWNLKLEGAQWFVFEEPMHLSRIGRTVGFTYSHDTGTIAQELMNMDPSLQQEEALLGAIRRQIALMTFLSTGGFYYVGGMQNVVRDRMDVWNPVILDEHGQPKYMLREDGYVGPIEGNTHDLTPFIRETIRMRQSFPVLDNPSSKRVLNISQEVVITDNKDELITIHAPMTAIQLTDKHGESLLVVINLTPASEAGLSVPVIARMLGRKSSEIEPVVTEYRGISVFRTTGLEMLQEAGFHASRAGSTPVHQLQVAG